MCNTWIQGTSIIMQVLINNTNSKSDFLHNSTNKNKTHVVFSLDNTYHSQKTREQAYHTCLSSQVSSLS